MIAPSGAASAALAAAFKTALLNEGELIFFIFVLLAIAWVTCRELLLAKARARLVLRLAVRQAASVAEPTARRVLRIGVGILWIFDGLLQAQPAMPGGMLSGVIASAVAGSPGWVVHSVGWAAAGWSAHPIEAAAGAVWIQLGLGIWLLSAASPRWSRSAGLMSLGWGLVVWIFGEAFGGMFAPGASWLMGAPGAALFYCAAGVLLALPLASWHDPRLGRGLLRASGALMLAFAVLQAWPGRGFWQGRLHGQPYSLAADIGAMAVSRQPVVMHRLVNDASSLAANHGFAVNLAVVIVLATTGGCLLSGRAALALPAATVAIALCVTDWVFVQDLGFLGGLGTDPNSMVPQALLLATGLVAMAAGPVAASTAPASTAPASTAPASTAPARLVQTPAWRPRRLPGRAVRGVGVALGMASTSSVLTLWAGAMVLLGVVPMAMATVQRHPAPAAAIAPGHSPVIGLSKAAAADGRAERRLPGPR